MANILDYFPSLIASAKDGYKDASIDLIDIMIRELKSNEAMSEILTQYLIECLQKTLDTKNANSGFNLVYPRGKQKKNTLERDHRAAELMYLSEDSSESYEQRLSLTANQLRKEFPDMILSRKSIETAYTSFRPVVIITRDPT